MFMVSSSQNNKFMYTVDVKLEQCDCPAGTGGQFCKHLCAVATLAMGNNVNSSFFMNMDLNSDSLPEDQKDFNGLCSLYLQSFASLLTPMYVQSSQEHTQVSEENCTNDNITAGI
ncbi:hypothetical protein QE152_g16933 [Popillia japonica]|uniref:SWIM-type domain-containing protein n=1 Tax=Popillia japonica TaxID=7064 RepID=A0AAW1L5U4_POPJA